MAGVGEAMSDIEKILMKVINKCEEASEAAIEEVQRRLEMKLRFRERRIERLEAKIEELEGRIRDKDSKNPQSPIRGL